MVISTSNTCEHFVFVSEGVLEAFLTSKKPVKVKNFYLFT